MHKPERPTAERSRALATTGFMPNFLELPDKNPRDAAPRVADVII
jgi:hypothetical protein